VTVVQRLADQIERLRVDQRVLVAIDGPDAAGKTTLARAVAAHLVRPAVTASVDGWHNPRTVRRRRGADSAEGYYLDSFDYEALVRECLSPFHSGAGRVRTASFDYQSDSGLETQQEVAPDAVLLFDGVFLLRPELRALWDLRVYLHVSESVTLARAVQRDVQLFGSQDEVRRRYERRYLPGQALYREEASPLEYADIVLDNTHPANPMVVRWPDTA
jgi:uridine kinase